MKNARMLRTTVGRVDRDVLAFTAGRDVILDRALIEADCLGTAAHVTMLARLPLKRPPLRKGEARRVVAELADIVRAARVNKFEIELADQDVHLAVERRLTQRLGDLGKKVHTGRSRNDQVAIDLRLFARGELLGAMAEVAALADALAAFGRRHVRVPMVGRTHMQPAMPSSVGLWAYAFAEGLLDDLALLRGTYDLNDRCPLGAAAGYGVPLPLDRRLTARLLGFARPVHSVLHAINARGKLESVILGALAQVMLTLSRMAQDLILFSMPEFGYFTLPEEFTTGSSIMPQKRNPDVLELVRSRGARVMGCLVAVMDIVRNAPSGYNRDLQDAKEPFMEGLATTRGCLRILAPLVGRLQVNRAALLKGFTPGVFATDYALDLVAQGMPFRDAYHHVKAHLGELENMDPRAALRRKRHLGAPAGLDFPEIFRRIRANRTFAVRESRRLEQVMLKLLG